jgi:hypothetical protein
MSPQALLDALGELERRAGGRGRGGGSAVVHTWKGDMRFRIEGLVARANLKSVLIGGMAPETRAGGRR